MTRYTLGVFVFCTVYVLSSNVMRANATTLNGLISAVGVAPTPVPNPYGQLIEQNGCDISKPDVVPANCAAKKCHLHWTCDAIDPVTQMCQPKGNDPQGNCNKNAPAYFDCGPDNVCNYSVGAPKPK